MLKQYNLLAKIENNFALYCIVLRGLLTISIVMMVFVLKIDTKEGLRTKLEGESTPGVPRLNRKFYYTSHTMYL